MSPPTRTPALVEVVDVTPGNVHDGRAGGGVVPDDPGEVFADSAYRGAHFAEAVRATRRGRPHRAHRLLGPRRRRGRGRGLRRGVKAIQRVRSRIEKIFGTWKRSYGLRRMRWRGIAKAALQVHLTAIAYNLRRGVTLLQTA